MGRKKNEEKYSDTVPVFRLKPEHADSGKIKHVGYFNTSEKLLDETIELDLKEGDKFYSDQHGKDVLYLGKIRGYEVTVVFNKCNLTGQFLIENTEYPLYYFNVFYRNNFVAGSLMEYYFTFSMTDEAKKELGKPSKYNGATVPGKYSYGLSVNEKVSGDHVTLLKNMLVEKHTSEYSKNNHGKEIDDEIMKEILDLVTKEASAYDYIFNRRDFVGNWISMKKIKHTFLEICSDEKFLNVVDVSIRSREQERRDEAGLDSDEEFTAPDEDKVIHISNKEEVMERFKDVLSL